MFGQVVRYDHQHQNGEVTSNVAVKEELKGQHRNYCLCYECAGLMKPDGSFKKRGVCPVARGLYRFVRKHQLVTPVFECPRFVQL